MTFGVFKKDPTANKIEEEEEEEEEEKEKKNSKQTISLKRFIFYLLLNKYFIWSLVRSLNLSVGN